MRNFQKTKIIAAICFFIAVGCFVVVSTVIETMVKGVGEEEMKAYTSYVALIEAAVDEWANDNVYFG